MYMIFLGPSSDNVCLSGTNLSTATNLQTDPRILLLDNISTIGAKTHRVPKVVGADGLVSADARYVNVDREYSIPDHEGRNCTKKETQIDIMPYRFVKKTSYFT